ncbi:MAG: hypothetical protein NVS3B21_28440 [Acidimicrobiales bacterium]
MDPGTSFARWRLKRLESGKAEAVMGTHAEDSSVAEDVREVPPHQPVGGTLRLRVVRLTGRSGTA